MISLLALIALAPQAEQVSYERDIAPLFVEHCVDCHGAEKRKAGLRLDSPAAVLAGSDNGEFAVIEPGDSAGSLLFELVATSDEDERMPPKGAPLTESEQALLRRWIDEGARVPADAEEQTSVHWAYVPPTRPLAPRTGDGWARSDLDRFVHARMLEHGLEPSPEADRATLLRRLSLDLTGLPPTLDELDAFLASEAPGAYEREVERLLSSPAYGERMARHWLDLARYADTNGYEKDDRRSMWRWRDWVIEAFNEDMPFDRFTIEQLAGDLLPDATLEQRIATGFHRNTMVNAEGGVDPEEYRVAAVVDRVDTTGSVWMGTTLACARCHTHKFDPISQREYFRLFAYFNSTADVGPSDQPRLEAPTPAQAEELEQRRSELAELEATLSTWTPALAAELEQLATESDDWQVLHAEEQSTEAGAVLGAREDGSVLLTGDPPERDVYRLTLPLEPGALRRLRLEVLVEPSLSSGGPGLAGAGNFVLSEVRARVQRANESLEPTTVNFTAAAADFFQTGQPEWRPEHAFDGERGTGWAVAGQLDSSHQLVLDLEALEVRPGDRLVLELDQQYGGQHVIGCLRVSSSAEASDGDPLLPPDIEALLAHDAELGAPEQERLQSWLLATTPSLAEQRARRDELSRLPGAPTVLVMQELPEPRATHVLERGSFLAPGEEVVPGVPAVMGALSPDSPPNRLGLARWLTSGQHPLTARVTVNRLWSQVFGRGLVRTEGDFGTKGEAPTHPKLLDWLACELVEGGWSIKDALRTLVTSATYRQSSRVTDEALGLDPSNLWLARGARYRVEAEMVRDVALACSGLLTTQLGGPSVFPPQPDGVWNSTYSGERWMSATDSDRFRRGLYTYWRRTAPYPTFMAFDAPSRELACTRRDASNTPLQALALLNDPAFVEAAVALATRMMREAGATPGERASHGFRLCTAREPDEHELAVLLDLFETERARFGAQPESARALLQLPFELDQQGLAPAELAAWAVVANVLLNLDETITRS